MQEAGVEEATVGVEEAIANEDPSYF